MLKRTSYVFCLALVASLSFPGDAGAVAEVCGDGIDNNSDGQADEGCYPAAVTAVCESPMSCRVAGSVAPGSGALVYQFASDLAPRVPYGPALRFQRTYTSMYDPGYNFPSASDYTHPLGYRMQHQYMSWLTLDTTPDPDEVILHTVKGQDVLFSFDQTTGGYDYYLPQPGHHFDYLRQDTSTPFKWELRTLAGNVYVYDWSSPTGKLIEIHDTLATPNKLTVTYLGSGQIDKVTDASGNRYFKFEYFGSGTKLLQYVKYYADATLRVTAECIYTADKLVDVKVAGSYIQRNTYNAAEYLTKVEAETGNTIAEFDYSTGTAGQVVRSLTGDGDIGYEYDAAGCDSGAGTYMTFNRKDTGTACDADADCGTGNYCGGETNTAGTNTGICFRARRCVSFTSPNETLVKDVTGSCTSCTGLEHYDFWTDTGDDKIELRGTLTADATKTSFEYNSDGLVVTRVENDDDYVATNTNPAASRTTLYTYGNSSFPGRVTEVRRLSDLKSGGTCTAATTTDCKRTIYAYTSDGLLDTTQEKGFTYDSSGTVTAYDFTTDRDYDSKGRMTKLKGPRASTNDDIDYTYWASGNGLSTDHLKEIKRYKDATTYITTTRNDYDFWGNSKRVTDSNSKSVCFTYEGIFGLVASRRQVINGSHTDCGTSGGNDETTSYEYNTRRQRTKMTRPKGNCVRYTYDAKGRLDETKMSDDSSGTCLTAADVIKNTYDADGRLTKIEWKDTSGTVKRKQEYTYHPDRRVEDVINPAWVGAGSVAQTWSYDDDGVPSEVQFEDYSTSDARTQWDVDSFNRPTKERRYTTSSANEEWSFTSGDFWSMFTQVSDDASHDIDLVWDDMGRKVKQVTPDSGTTIYNYDEAGNLTDRIEDDGGADEKTNTYKYDTLNRVIAEDTGDAKCFTLGGAEYQYTYDALPGGISCPGSSTCDLLSGRLAYVKAQMWCDNAKSDDQFDQETFYSYDEAGRVEQHTVQDDGSRLGRTSYTYDKNSNATRIDYPAGSSTGAVYTFGTASTSDPDNDKVRSMARDKTGLLYNVGWLPYGPLEAYLQYNGFWHTIYIFGNPYNVLYNVLVGFTSNSAYRTTQIYARSTWSTPDDVHKIDFAEDARGRYTKRDFSYGTSGQKDMFFLYDNLSRVTCRTATSQSTCPTTPEEGFLYNNSGDRTEFDFNNGPWYGDVYSTAYNTGTDQVASVETDGAGTVTDYAYDGRGNRTLDDEDNANHDDRTYTYDARNNLITIAGDYLYGPSDWNPYVVTYAYDERNRRIFKSFKDTDLSKEAQWFYYYDNSDRLIQAKHTPDIATSTTYSVFQWYWLARRPVVYYQTDYVIGGGGVTRRYLHGDEQGRPLAAWSFPTSGDTARVWQVNPNTFGWDVVNVGSTVYQPLRFPGQQYDEDTEAFDDSGTQIRPGICDNRYRSYDSYTGTYLQVDPLVDDTWEAYNYVEQNPVMSTDPLGLAVPPIGFVEPFSVFRLGADMGPSSVGCYTNGHCPAEFSSCAGECGIVIRENDLPPGGTPPNCMNIVSDCATLGDACVEQPPNDITDIGDVFSCAYGNCAHEVNECKACAADHGCRSAFNQLGCERRFVGMCRRRWGRSPFPSALD